MENSKCYVRSHANNDLKKYIPVITDLTISLKTKASKNSSENLEAFVDTISNDPISISFGGVMQREDVDFFLKLRNSRDLIDFKFVKITEYTYEGYYITSLTFKETKEKTTTIEFNMSIEEVKLYDFLKVTMIQVDETEIKPAKEVSPGKTEQSKITRKIPIYLNRGAGTLHTTTGEAIT